MPDPNRALSWIHLSDFHFRASTRWESSGLFKALLVDIQEQIKAKTPICPPSFVIVTGDVAFSGKPQEYDQANQFFERLLTQCGLHRDRLFVVPGNHDVDRSKFSHASKSIFRLLREGAASHQNEHMIAEIFQASSEKDTRKAIFAPFMAYNEFTPDACKLTAGRLFWTQRIQFPELLCSVVLVGLNSAWAATGEADQGNLLLGSYQIYEALNDFEIEPDELIFTLVHHPLDWLKEWDQQEVKKALFRSHFVLRGHLHAQEEVIIPSGPIHIAVGSSYASRDYPNSYCFGELDLTKNQATIYVRRWFNERGGFFRWDPAIGSQDSPGRMIIPLNFPSSRQNIVLSQNDSIVALDSSAEAKDISSPPAIAISDDVHLIHETISPASGQSLVSPGSLSAPPGVHPEFPNITSKGQAHSRVLVDCYPHWTSFPWKQHLAAARTLEIVVSYWSRWVGTYEDELLALFNRGGSIFIVLPSPEHAESIVSTQRMFSDHTSENICREIKRTAASLIDLYDKSTSKRKNLDVRFYPNRLNYAAVRINNQKLYFGFYEHYREARSHSGIASAAFLFDLNASTKLKGFWDKEYGGFKAETAKVKLNKLRKIYRELTSLRHS